MEGRMNFDKGKSRPFWNNSSKERYESISLLNNRIDNPNLKFDLLIEDLKNASSISTCGSNKENSLERFDNGKPILGWLVYKKNIYQTSFPPHLLVSQNDQDFQNREFGESQENQLESLLEQFVIKQTIFNKKLVGQLKTLKEQASTLEKNVKIICTQKDALREQVEQVLHGSD
ncbi:hypothetical protein QL285_062449 [Trifolium repens]|jgi:hypothetical protein|nr:hypothetical protein QL285_062449 [Trifolium repens]